MTNETKEFITVFTILLTTITIFLMGLLYTINTYPTYQDPYQKCIQHNREAEDLIKCQELKPNKQHD